MYKKLLILFFIVLVNVALGAPKKPIKAVMIDDEDPPPKFISYFDFTPYVGVVSAKEKVEVSAPEVSSKYLLSLDMQGKGVGFNTAFRYKTIRTEIDFFVYQITYTGQLSNSEIQFLNSSISGLGYFALFGYAYSPKGEDGGYFIGLKGGIFSRSIDWTSKLKSQLTLAQTASSDLGLLIDTGFKFKHLSIISKFGSVQNYESIFWQFGIGYNF